MKTTAKTDIVNYVLGLFATAVLLVAWPRGKKGGRRKWKQITAQDMMDRKGVGSHNLHLTGLRGDFTLLAWRESCEWSIRERCTT